MKLRSESVADESDFPTKELVRHLAFADFEGTDMLEPNFGSRSLPSRPSFAVNSVHATPKERRGCKCKHSKCLKLYCECFASGTYCDECGCVNCRNNFENETVRQAAIGWALERKPNAFRRMAGQHIILNAEDAAKSVLMEGCHCKRSRCLKKYCNCFRANSLCSEKCTCMDCKNVYGNLERLAFHIGKDASMLTKVQQANLVIAGAVGHSGYKPFRDFMSRSDQISQSLNTEDPLNCEPAQAHQLVHPPLDCQLLATATMGSSKLAYRSLLAGLIRPNDIRELSAHLVVVSETDKDFEGDNKMGMVDSLANQDVENSHGLLDQNVETIYNLQRKLVNQISELDPRSSDRDQQNGRPVSPGTLTSDMILDFGCSTDVHAEQERLVLVNFRDYLIKLIARGKVKERQVSMSAGFGTEYQHEYVVLDHEAEILSKPEISGNGAINTRGSEYWENAATPSTFTMVRTSIKSMHIEVQNSSEKKFKTPKAEKD